jgi:hypothetical protein
MYLVTIQSVIAALLGTRQRWQATQRNGVFTDTATSGQPVASTRTGAETPGHGTP